MVSVPRTKCVFTEGIELVLCKVKRLKSDFRKITREMGIVSEWSRGCVASCY